jgi:hypothetical protein
MRVVGEKQSCGDSIIGVFFTGHSPIISIGLPKCQINPFLHAKFQHIGRSAPEFDKVKVHSIRMMGILTLLTVLSPGL